MHVSPPAGRMETSWRWVYWGSGTNNEYWTLLQTSRGLVFPKAFYFPVGEETLVFNPLIPESDQHLISPFNITHESNIKVMRIKKMIIN